MAIECLINIEICLKNTLFTILWAGFSIEHKSHKKIIKKPPTSIDVFLTLSFPFVIIEL